MARKSPILLPKSKKILTVLGENIKSARLRRWFSAELVAERASISRPTLISIEKGSGSVSIGNYLLVLTALGLENDLLHVAKDDLFGREIKDIAGGTVRKRAPKR